MSRIRTPLYYAMINNHLDACRLLLKNGATPVDGCDVLISAVGESCASMVKLIAKNAYNDGFNVWSFLISGPPLIPDDMRKLLLDINETYK